MNQKEAAEYLARLGLAAIPEKGAAQLDLLIRTHVGRVPFENLDVYDYGKVPDLDERALFEKVVAGRRGGYCFELNSLFLALLRALGYEAYPVAVRILWNKETLPPLSHMGIVVEEGGERYFCDVGYGGPGPKGLTLFTPGEQMIAGEEFRVQRTREEEVRIERRSQGEWKALLQFSERPFNCVDFQLLNFYCAKSPAVLFTQKRVVNLYMEDGSKSLMDMELTVKKAGHLQKTVYQSREELERGLAEEFGLQLSLSDSRACGLP